MIRSAQSSYESRLIQHSQTNPKLLYRYINSKQKNQSDITQLKKFDGTMTLSNAEASEELNCFCKSIKAFQILQPEFLTQCQTSTYQKKQYFIHYFL